MNGSKRFSEQRKGFMVSQRLFHRSTSANLTFNSFLSHYGSATIPNRSERLNFFVKPSELVGTKSSCDEWRSWWRPFSARSDKDLNVEIRVWTANEMKLAIFGRKINWKTFTLSGAFVNDVRWFAQLLYKRNWFLSVSFRTRAIQTLISMN